VQRFSVLVFFLFFFSSLVVGCGGGGGGGGYAGSGRVDLSLEPNRIDVGDRTRISVQISEVNPDGALLKLHIPDALSYVSNTGVLSVGGQDFDVAPDIDVLGDSQDRYLVFFFLQSDFGDGRSGRLRLELQADASVADGYIEVDIDVDDPDVNNLLEFSIDDPRFQVDQAKQIIVEDS